MKALILVDIQNDFLPGGALAVGRGHEVVPVANAVMPAFDLVVATMDWHPPDHVSFASRFPGQEIGKPIRIGDTLQILWPDHCVQNTHGAALADELDTSRIDRVFHKGEDRTVDSYSGFFDNERRKSTGLAEYLREQGVDEVYVMGLALEYCVKATAMDAREQGFATRLIRDGTRGVELRFGDGDQAVAEMKAAGVEVVKEFDILYGNE